MPLITIGVVYAGVVVGLMVMALVGTPEYEHVNDLHVGVTWLAWSVLAIAGLAVSVTSLRRSAAALPNAFQWMAVALQAVVVIMLALAVPLSILSLVAYIRGFAVYDSEVARCGHPPVLASPGWGGDVLLPTDSEYERLKYAPVDPLLLGPTTYFCTLADAEAHGYQRQSWHS
jgi:hypothetical protein